MKTTALDRALLFAMVLFCAYQIVVGIDPLSMAPIAAYTVSFGVLLVAGLLLIILGFDALDAPVVVIISTIIPLALSLGLVWEHYPAYGSGYSVFAAAGFGMVVLTRTIFIRGRMPALVIALVHGAAGLIIFLLPFVLTVQGAAKPYFALVGLGGALIGCAGLLLTFLKAGRPILPREAILKIFPALLFVMCACFVAGFNLG